MATVDKNTLGYKKIVNEIEAGIPREVNLTFECPNCKKAALTFADAPFYVIEPESDWDKDDKILVVPLYCSLCKHEGVLHINSEYTARQKTAAYNEMLGGR